MTKLWCIHVSMNVRVSLFTSCYMILFELLPCPCICVLFMFICVAWCRTRIYIFLLSWWWALMSLATKKHNNNKINSLLQMRTRQEKIWKSCTSEMALIGPQPQPSPGIESPRFVPGYLFYEYCSIHHMIELGNIRLRTNEPIMMSGH